TRALVPHGHGPDFQSVLCGEFPRARGQFEPRQLPKLPFQSRAKVGNQGVRGELKLATADEPDRIAVADFDASWFTAQEDLRAVPPGVVAAGFVPALLKLLFKPRQMPVGDASGLGPGTTPGNGDPH